jgi:mono/diheme cytochrome c family protein
MTMTDGGSEQPDPGDGSDAGGGEMPGPSEAYLRGEAIAVANECADCHRENYAGAGFFPNISPDNTTGIGKWTDAQIAAAVKDGVGNDGKTLCSGMPKFELSDAEMSDLIVFLRGIPAVKKSITSICPGHGK